MNRTPRALLFSLMLGLAPTIASAAEDDLDFDDDFFDEVSKDKKGKTDRGDRDLPDPDEDPMDDEIDEDPEWDARDDPDIIDDPPDDLGDPGGDFGGDFGDDFGEDPPEDNRQAAVAPTGDFDDFDEDPPDEFERPAPRKKAAPKPPPKKVAPSGPARLTLKTSGKEPLTGAYTASVVALDVDAVIVELPVLIATSGGSYDGGEFMVVSEFMLGDKKVGESRHLVSAATIADLGPTVVWVKQHVPVTDPSGSIEVNVSRVDAEDPPSPLFTKTVDYRL
jgi:hypothetical protein